MRSKAPLMMIEQMVMLLVFALAAVLCLQAFTLSQNISQQNVYRDRAVIEAQNAAEAMKSGHGDTYFKEMEAHIDDRGRVITYDENWNPVDTSEVPAARASFILTLSYTDSEQDYLSTAVIAVCTSDGEELFKMKVAWQDQEVRDRA
ncbi:hypothetical protein ACDL92_00580 [Ihubacter sp. mB4P-1]|uniref:type IV pilus modification PilV family protein n=1 Tax=Ihubacter sp. mB4P-1 TaxID=3242370 RepID=UPI0013794FA2